MKNKSSRRRVLFALVLLLLVLMLLVELLREKIMTSFDYGELVYVICSRIIGGVSCTALLLLLSFEKMLSPKTSLRAFLIFIPCMAVAVNNFPFITYFTGRAHVDSGAAHVLLYAFSCVCTAFFEEMAFRGCVFTSILQVKGSRRSDVFWSIALSSAVFGLVHLVNLFVGASPISVILQVGYSFLIGAMCSVILVRTVNIWYCVLLHAVYNFAGGVVPECGGGQLWDTPTVVLTTIIALLVTAYVIYLLVKTERVDVERFLNKKMTPAGDNGQVDGGNDADV